MVRGSETGEPLSRLLLHTLLSAACFLGLIMVLSVVFRSELSTLGGMFVTRLGIAGMALGTFLSDGLLVPVPPQVYLLMGVLGRSPPVPLVAAVALGSVLGGLIAYVLGRPLSRIPLLARLLSRTKERVDGVLSQRGLLALVCASLLPVPFSLLCYSAGLYRMRFSLFAIFLALRAPRIAVYYLLIRAGWIA